MNKTINQVKYLLQNYETTRDDDFKLIALYYNEFYGINQMIQLYYASNRNLPTIATLIRSRQKLQEKHAELRGSKYTERKTRLERKYREFYGKEYKEI